MRHTPFSDALMLTASTHEIATAILRPPRKKTKATKATHYTCYNCGAPKKGTSCFYCGVHETEEKEKTAYANP